MSSLAAKAASAKADEAGIDPLLVRVLCVRCAKRLEKPDKLDGELACK